jgi:hypothetical protein
MVVGDDNNGWGDDDIIIQPHPHEILVDASHDLARVFLDFLRMHEDGFRLTSENDDDDVRNLGY